MGTFGAHEYIADSDGAIHINGIIDGDGVVALFNFFRGEYFGLDAAKYGIYKFFPDAVIVAGGGGLRTGRVLRQPVSRDNEITSTITIRRHWVALKVPQGFSVVLRPDGGG